MSDWIPNTKLESELEINKVSTKTRVKADEGKKETHLKEEKYPPFKEDKETSPKDEKDSSSSEEKDFTETPPKIGNFSLPTSQQPAALFGFGGNIIDKGEVQLYLFADDFEGPKKMTIDIIPNVLFGVTDNFSISFDVPFTPSLKDGHAKSSGLEDFFIQIEYAFYNKQTSYYIDQATIVANITVPTGSIKKNPPTGFDAPSLFLGGTYYRTWVDWLAFTSYAAVLTTSTHGYKAGDQFLYQMGFGKNFPSPIGWIYAWLIEVDGQYNKKTRVGKTLDNNIGGNVIYITPSIWLSSKRFLLQFGVSFPINQNLFGKQNKFDYALNLNVAWSFY
ncbi:MAG: hypothetical protein H0X29_02430 [Parachlamydiaceae bacterium]|nr:hypothetical protein [Parachlamydiaceae bacterium]